MINDTPYIWTIKNLNTQDRPYAKTVVSVDWELVLERSGHRVSTFGTTRLPQPNFNDFTNFDQLTEQQVIEWVKTYMGEGEGRNSRNYQQVLADLELQMQAVENPDVVPNPAPWSNE